MPQEKLTIEQFAQAVKARAPELANLPDDVLVREVLERRPDMRDFLVTQEPRPPLKRGIPFAEQAYRKLQENIRGIPRGISQTIQQRSAEGREALGRGDYAGAFATAPFHALQDVIGGGVTGVYNVSTPGLVERIAKGEDPAQIAADMAAFLPMGEAEPVEAGAKMVRGMGRTILGVPLQEFAGAGREPVLTAYEDYVKAVRDLQTARAQDVGKYAQKVREAQADFAQKAEKTRRAMSASQAAEQRRTGLQQTQQDLGNRLRENLRTTFGRVKQSLDGRWDALRKTSMTRGGAPGILKDELLDSKRIADAVDKAERDYLQGAPESVKQFRDLMRWMEAEGSEAVGGEAGGKTKRLRPITWDEARTHYTALGDRQFSGDLPGNVRKAIDFVRREGLGEQLRAGAERAGALPTYESLLRDWSGFENDWRNVASVTMKGGSPLARALPAPNAATLIPQITGKTGDLLIERLAKYTDYGASPETARAILKTQQDLSNLTVPKPPTSFPELELPTPLGPRANIDPFSPAAVRERILRDYAGRPFMPRDIVPPFGLEHLLLKSPAIREAVAGVPRYELRLRPEPAPTPIPPVNVAPGPTGAPPGPSPATPSPPPGPRQGPFRPAGQGPFPMPPSSATGGAPQPARTVQDVLQQARQQRAAAPAPTRPPAPAAPEPTGLQGQILNRLRQEGQGLYVSSEGLQRATGASAAEIDAALKELQSSGRIYRTESFSAGKTYINAALK